jgi:hypothetical protein
MGVSWRARPRASLLRARETAAAAAAVAAAARTCAPEPQGDAAVLQLGDLEARDLVPNWREVERRHGRLD